MKTQITFCIAHQCPLLPEGLYDYTVGIGNYHPKRGVHVSGVDPFWDRARPIAYGAAGSHVIPRVMEKNSFSTELAGICTYRKIVTRRRTVSELLEHGQRGETVQTVAPQLTYEDTRPWEGSDFLVPEPVEYPYGVVGHYVHEHHAIDLFEYVSVAFRIGVLSFSEVEEFSTETVFIPGGCELGVYPRDWLHGALKSLESVGREFLSLCGRRIATYDRYQVRAVGFLAERLGSYLLLSELRALYPKGIAPSVFGDLHVIVPDGASYSRGLADSE